MKRMILLAIMVMAILTGCQQSGEGNGYKVIVANPIIMTHDIVDSGMDMEVIGSLSYNEENQCMYLVEESTEDLLLAIWPKGTVPMMENNQYGINMKGMGPVLEGESLKLGGGGIDKEEIQSSNYPKECLDLVEEVILINHPS